MRSIAAVLFFLLLLSPCTASAQGVADGGSPKAPLVVLETTMGDIVLELNPEKAPITVENFLSYVDKGFYDGTIFHRVIESFMIQGGGFDQQMKQKPTAAGIRNESNNGLSNDLYTIAMARRSDPHSATSQFFINVKNNPDLNPRSPRGDGWGYAVFGRVVDGMDVVDRIKSVPTGRVAIHDDVPRTPIIIKRAYIARR